MDCSSECARYGGSTGPAPNLRLCCYGTARVVKSDFVRKSLAEGQPFRVLRVLDQWSRHNPLREVGTRMLARPWARPSIGCGTICGNRDLSLWIMRRNSNNERLKPGRIAEVWARLHSA